MDSLVLLLRPWVYGLSFLLVLQFLVFLYAYRKKRIDLVDVFWGLSFIFVGAVYLLLNISNLNIATATVFFCVTIWGLRLTSHIFKRFKSRRSQDERYTAITKSYIGSPVLVYIKIFAVQAVLGSLVMTVFLAAMSSSKYNSILLGIGLIIWLLGLIFESVADMQLERHITLRPGELMKTGLWKYSRHPNYFGELVQWWAIWLITAGGEFAVIGLIGPLSISILIIFVSGIPPLEKHMAEKKGWQDYKKRTSILIPWLSL
ncbi:DUF1295 domain-containing protein [Candidatus Saccharibacteria bacterium]|nr:DUF1295 domain-containing protein [Candidatus Saccharibacteria bacterium]